MQTMHELDVTDTRHIVKRIVQKCLHCCYLLIGITGCIDPRRTDWASATFARKWVLPMTFVR